MAKTYYRWGYCPHCVKNIPHYPVPNSALAHVLVLSTFGQASRFRLGPWYCVHCETRSIYLKEERSDALRFRHANDTTDPPSGEISSANESTPSIGNFLKSEQSLVMRNSRLKRFTEKYRDSIVRRLLSGSSTITQIRREKDISEGELTDWIADLFNRMQHRLDLFEQSVGSQPRISMRAIDENDSLTERQPSSRTIDGQAKPK